MSDALISVLPSSDIPLVAYGLATEWRACRSWNLDYLSQAVPKTIQFRLSKRNSKDIQWEPECPSVEATVKQFSDWVHGRLEDSNPFTQYPIDSWWAYADYIRMANDTTFSELCQDLNFTALFPFLDFDIGPTFWLGSSNSNTICHRDTYGINLVVQICGSKRWVLFPPSDNHFLYETRIPLEESTVFSAVNFPRPDLSRFPLIQKASPVSITLQPGDVLFVPRSWWHYVESTGDSLYTCSVNIWLDQPILDDKVRIREALTQISGFSLLSSCAFLDPMTLLHPPEQELYSSDLWFPYLLDHLNHLIRIPSSKSCESDRQAILKKPKLSDITWNCLAASTVAEIFDCVGHKNSDTRKSSTPKITYQKLIEAFLKPDVIDLVAKHLEFRTYSGTKIMQDTVRTGGSLKLRCKLPSGQHIIDVLTPESTVAELLQAISIASGIHQTNMIIYYGYPPKRLTCMTDELQRTLSEIPLHSGDTITVDTLKQPLEVPVTQSPKSGPTNHVPDTEPNKPAMPRLVRLTAPSDNSCLFTSVLFCINNANGRLPVGSKVVTNLDAVSQLRELIGAIVLSDPQCYSEAFLGMPNERYARCIQEPDRWGGGIEVSVLSQLHEIEICVVDIQSCRVDRFGEDKQYPQRILLMYDGIHYDPIAQERPAENRLVSVFSARDNMILVEAQALASRLREEREFTDLTSFTLICGQCNTPLTGQSGAQKHAMDTGHTDYREINL